MELHNGAAKSELLETRALHWDSPGASLLRALREADVGICSSVGGIVVGRAD